MLRHTVLRKVGYNGCPAALPAAFSKFAPSASRWLQVKVNGDNAQVEISPVKAYKCDQPATWVNTTKQEVIQGLRDMMLMRRMEIAADLMYKSQLIKGFCHLYDGQVRQTPPVSESEKRAQMYYVPG